MGLCFFLPTPHIRTNGEKERERVRTEFDKSSPQNSVLSICMVSKVFKVLGRIMEQYISFCLSEVIGNYFCRFFDFFFCQELSSIIIHSLSLSLPLSTLQKAESETSIYEQIVWKVIPGNGKGKEQKPI